MMGLAVCRHDFDRTRAIMVGDRLDTDILFGQAGGVSTLLVLTGELAFCECGCAAEHWHERDHEAIGDNRPRCISHRARVRERESGRSARSRTVEVDGYSNCKH